MSFISHDVRHLTVCAICKKLDDSRNMIGERKAGYVHGRCYIKQNGLKHFLALPKEVTDRLCLDDIGARIMAKLFKLHY